MHYLPPRAQATLLAHSPYMCACVYVHIVFALCVCLHVCAHSACIMCVHIILALYVCFNVCLCVCVCMHVHVVDMEMCVPLVPRY